MDYIESLSKNRATGPVKQVRSANYEDCTTPNPVVTVMLECNHSYIVPLVKGFQLQPLRTTYQCGQCTLQQRSQPRLYED